MTFLLINVCFLFYLCAYVQADCNNIQGYFWLDFTGEVPTCALPAGRDVYGKPIYFGQVVDPIGKLLIPCKIFVNERRAYYELYRVERIATRNIKVFCTYYPKQFEWIKTNNKDINSLTDKQLIIGGWEPHSTTTYIGRVRQGGEVLVGKIITNVAEEHFGLHVTTGGTATQFTTSYEVLSYNPKRSTTTVCNGLDGYFWVDFTGEVPRYALPGGKDISGNPIYFGQVIGNVTQQHLVPAEIYLNDNRAYFAYGRQGLNLENTIKIFCTQHPEHFEWIKTDIDAIRLLTDKQLVIGGWEPKYTTYFGRVRYGGRVCIGKVLADIDEDPVNAGLHINYEGEARRFTKFEVLAYNPKLSDKPAYKDVEGYYWRDYKGILPKDALEGTYDTITSYIGQTLHSGVVVPGPINGFTKKMSYEWDSQVYEENDRIKILCSAHPEHFEWISTKSLNFKNVADKNLVLGGYEFDNDFYIGRVDVNGEYLIGRVNLQSSESNGVLFTLRKDGMLMEHSTFEVLTFNEDIESPQIQTPRDGIATNSRSENCQKFFINLYIKFI